MAVAIIPSVHRNWGSIQGTCEQHGLDQHRSTDTQRFSRSIPVCFLFCRWSPQVRRADCLHWSGTWALANLSIQAGPGTNPCGYRGTSVGEIKIYTRLPGVGGCQWPNSQFVQDSAVFCWFVWPNPLICNFFCIDNKDSILFIDLIVEEIFIKILKCHHIISWMSGVQLWQNPMIYFITDTGIQNSRGCRKETKDKNLLNVCPESGRSPPARCEVHGHSTSAGWESVTRQPAPGLFPAWNSDEQKGECAWLPTLPSVTWYSSPSMRLFPQK